MTQNASIVAVEGDLKGRAHSSINRDELVEKFRPNQFVNYAKQPLVVLCHRTEPFRCRRLHFRLSAYSEAHILRGREKAAADAAAAVAFGSCPHSLRPSLSLSLSPSLQKYVTFPLIASLGRRSSLLIEISASEDVAVN
uniref:Uncharacterized protein n=1 Tax=Kalanchoe fedtschenkoi TaxID=63787 RepID=A0A7N0VIK5_KALFE